MRECLLFAKSDEIMSICNYLIDNDDARVTYANKCYEVIKRRRVVDMLQQFFKF